MLPGESRSCMLEIEVWKVPREFVLARDPDPEPLNPGQTTPQTAKLKSGTPSQQNPDRYSKPLNQIKPRLKVQGLSG